MIVGERVVIERLELVGTDRLGQPIHGWVPETVDNVLVGPGPRSDLNDVERPEGLKVVWNLHFPKGYPATLENARIRVRGGDPLHVVGSPQHYTDANTPGDWSMPCEVWRADG